MTKYIFVIFFLLTGLYSCDKLSIDSINPYSGRWTISFGNESNTALREGTITIFDNGTMCSRISALSNDSLYLAGQINMSGNFQGNFTDTCGSSISGSVAGNFTELLGIFHGQGNWSDSIGGVLQSGQWSARKH
jgi:hypothetical protein